MRRHLTVNTELALDPASITELNPSKKFQMVSSSEMGHVKGHVDRGEEEQGRD